jgi:hypothetical protein
MNLRTTVLIAFFILSAMIKSNAGIYLKLEGDSISIKTIIVPKRMPCRSKAIFNIYINNHFYKKTTSSIDGFIYLPDSLRSNDKIKIEIIRHAEIKSKIYNLKYSQVRNQSLKIRVKKPYRPFSKKHYGCGGNFW